MQGPARLVPLERERETAELRSGQEPLPALAPVAPDADAGVGAFRSIAIDLGLAQDDREDGGGAVRRAGPGSGVEGAWRFPPQGGCRRGGNRARSRVKPHSE